VERIHFILFFIVIDASLQRVPGRKRIQVMNDSESESDHPKTPKKFELSIKDKEDRLIASKRLFPDHDTMVTFIVFFFFLILCNKFF